MCKRQREREAILVISVWTNYIQTEHVRVTSIYTRQSEREPVQQLPLGAQQLPHFRPRQGQVSIWPTLMWDQPASPPPHKKISSRMCGCCVRSCDTECTPSLRFCHTLNTLPFYTLPFWGLVTLNTCCVRSCHPFWGLVTLNTLPFWGLVTLWVHFSVTPFLFRGTEEGQR